VTEATEATEELIGGLPMFELLDAGQRRWLAERSEVADVPGGVELVVEDGPPSGFWLLIEGEVEVRRHVAGVDVRMGGGDQPGTWFGAVPYVHELTLVTGVVVRQSRLLRVPDEVMTHMLDHGFPIAPHLLRGVSTGHLRFGAQVAGREQLASLGRLSAGLAHELNNPVSALVRAIAQARTLVAVVERAAVMLTTAVRAAGGDAPDLTALAAKIEARRAGRSPLSGLRRAEVEDAVAELLAGVGYDDPDGGAAVLVDAGLDGPCVAELLADESVAREQGALVAWAIPRAELTTLLAEAGDAAGRMSEIVAKVKEYSHRDRAPVGDIDVRRGVDDTLAVLRAKLAGITVVRDYADEVPVVVGSGGELNQVWTNLIDNAAGALRSGGGSRITVAVSAADGHVVVAVEDDGPGIPVDVQARLFEPFFTTKAVGAGTGLGLDIARRIVEAHRGTIGVTSEPGWTRFTVRLPARLNSDERPPPESRSGGRHR
jgi:signal transduction histidine kinase